MCNASKTQWHRSTAFARGDDVREIIGLTERKMDSYLAVGNWVKCFAYQIVSATYQIYHCVVVQFLLFLPADTSGEKID